MAHEGVFGEAKFLRCDLRYNDALMALHCLTAMRHIPRANRFARYLHTEAYYLTRARTFVYHALTTTDTSI